MTSISSYPAFSLDFPYAHGAPVTGGLIRSCDADFCVDELLGFVPSGEGEHLYLRIEKQGQNTQWLAKQLALFAAIRPQDVGYAGLKDRHAVTCQWFSLWLPGRELDLEPLALPGVRVLEQGRHGRKLKRGAHLGNRFRITVRELPASPALEQRLATVAAQGVPNYFGEQRFGRDGGNLVSADSLLRGERRVKDRNRRGLFLSAARSYLFNQILAERVRRDCWNRYLAGDRLMRAGTTELLSLEDSASRQAEVASAELHPTIPLWGRGRDLVSDAAAALEADILAAFAPWCEGLERAGLTRERRSARLLPTRFSWQWLADDALRLDFVLPPGAFATSVLRECCGYTVAQRNDDETTALQR